MKLKFMRLTTEEIPFTNWVKPDLYRTFDITLKFSAPPRLRKRYRLGAGSSRYGNCFFLNEPSCTARRETVSDARGVLKRFLGENRHGSAWHSRRRVLEPTGARERVRGPDVIPTATVKGARDGARVGIMAVGARELRVGRPSRDKTRIPLMSVSGFNNLQSQP